MGNIWAGYGFFITTLFIITVLFSFYLYVVKPTGFKNSIKLSKKKINEFSPTIKFLLIVAVLLIIIGFWMPFLLTRKSLINELDFSNTGAIGDTFGGIINPFVALSAVIVTGLAFYMQFQANKQVQDQFKLQQFESQFYEMLRLHKENVNEMEIEGYEYRDKILGKPAIKDDKITKGRKVFVTMITELECIYLIIKKCYCENVEFLIFKDKIYSFPKKDDGDYFLLAYEIFFHGLHAFEEGINNKKYQNFNLNFLKALLNEVKDIRKHHENGLSKKNRYYLNKKQPNLVQISDSIEMIDNKEFPELKLYFNYKPFSGHQSRLGHYYRHLIASVGLVVKTINLNYEEKREYLKLLRSQLSNHELVLLYYNFISGYGDKWENNKNSFLIDYRMLHNIQEELVLPEFNPVDKLLSIKDAFLYKNDDSYSDSLFELYDSISNLSVEDNRKLKSNE